MCKRNRSGQMRLRGWLPERFIAGLPRGKRYCCPGAADWKSAIRQVGNLRYRGHQKPLAPRLIIINSPLWCMNGLESRGPVSFRRERRLLVHAAAY
jgi:hypothetical protein